MHPVFWSLTKVGDLVRKVRGPEICSLVYLLVRASTKSAPAFEVGLKRHIFPGLPDLGPPRFSPVGARVRRQLYSNKYRKLDNKVGHFEKTCVSWAARPLGLHAL